MSFSSWRSRTLLYVKWFVRNVEAEILLLALLLWAHMVVLLGVLVVVELGSALGPVPAVRPVGNRVGKASWVNRPSVMVELRREDPLATWAANVRGGLDGALYGYHLRDPRPIL